MIPLPGEWKVIAKAAVALFAMALGCAAVVYHLWQVAALRETCAHTQAVLQKAQDRNAELEHRLRVSAAQIEQANRALAAAKRQAETTSQSLTRLDDLRQQNRKAIRHVASVAPETPPRACLSFPAPLWRRLDDLFLRNGDGPAATADSATEDGLRKSDASAPPRP